MAAGNDARGDDRRDRAAGRVGVGEGGEQRLDRLGRAQQPHRDLGRDPERALRADERADEVVAGGVGRRAGAELDDLAVGRDDLEARHVVGGEAVLQAVRAAGVLGHVAADRADLLARRVGRVEVAVGRTRRG